MMGRSKSEAIYLSYGENTATNNSIIEMLVHAYTDANLVVNGSVDTLAWYFPLPV